MCLSVGFLEKWDQCVINALKGEFYCSMPPTPLRQDRVPLLDTGPHERLKVQYYTMLFIFHTAGCCHCEVVSGFASRNI